MPRKQEGGSLHRSHQEENSKQNISEFSLLDDLFNECEPDIVHTFPRLVIYSSDKASNSFVALMLSSQRPETEVSCLLPLDPWTIYSCADGHPRVELYREGVTWLLPPQRMEVSYNSGVPLLGSQFCRILILLGLFFVP